MNDNRDDITWQEAGMTVLRWLTFLLPWRAILSSPVRGGRHV